MPGILGRPTIEGNTARGASSPAKPALHMPDPLRLPELRLHKNHGCNSWTPATCHHSHVLHIHLSIHEDVNTSNGRIVVHIESLAHVRSATSRQRGQTPCILLSHPPFFEGVSLCSALEHTQSADNRVCWHTTGTIYRVGFRGTRVVLVGGVDTAVQISEVEIHPRNRASSGN